MTRKLSIISGLILFTFVAVHLSNLALGVFSIEVIDVVRPKLMAPFSNPVGGILLFVVLLLHIVLGAMSLYRRNTLHMSRHDTVQLVSALLIIPLLVPHAWSVIAAQNLLEVNTSYQGLFQFFWIDSPLQGLLQVFLVVVIWVHGCIGLFTWLKLQPWWSRASSFIYPLAVAIPVMALLGFVEGGNLALSKFAAVQEQVQADTYSDEYSDAYSKPEPEKKPERQSESLDPAEFAATATFIEKIKWQIVLGYFVFLLLVLSARYLRVRKNNQFIEVRYATGQSLRREVGPTLLELANINDIPHANLCRGRGRCGTCKIKIIESDCPLTPPSSTELATLARTNSAADVRLACQLTPGPGVIRIERLLRPDIQPQDLHNGSADLTVSNEISTQNELVSKEPVG